MDNFPSLQVECIAGRPHVFFLDQLWELVCFGGLYLAAVFAQFRRDPWQPQRLINVFFRGAKDFAPVEDVLEGMI
jgi:hypothetical protein